MNRFFLILFLFLLKTIPSPGQVKVPVLTQSLGTGTGKHSFDPRSIAYSDDKGYLLMGISDGIPAFERINNDLTSEPFNVIDNKTEEGDVLQYSGMQVLNKNVCVFWIKEDSKKNQFTLYYSLFDPTTGKESKSKSVLCISKIYPKDKGIVPLMNVESRYNNYFRSEVSPDHQKLIIIFPDNSTSSENETLSINEFDSLLSPLKQTKYSYNIKHQNFLLKDIQFTDAGDIGFSGIEIQDGSGAALPIYYQAGFPYSRPIGVFHLTTLKNGAEDFVDRKIILDGKLITDVAFRLDADKIQVMGFYSNVVDYSNREVVNSANRVMNIDKFYSKGSFFHQYKYDDLTPELNTTNEFTQQLINDCDISAAPRGVDFKRRKTEAYALTAQRIEKMPNGDFVLFSEQLAEYSWVVLYSGNIVLPRYSVNGEYLNTANIARFELPAQASTNYIYEQDYFSYISNGDIFIVYSKGFLPLQYKMDEKYNEASMQNDIPESSIVYARITSEGKTDKKLLEDIPARNFYELIQSCSFIDVSKRKVFLAGTDFKDYFFYSFDID